MSNRIVLITPGQPSSNPRLTKEAIALNNAGFNVTVLYSHWVTWADKFDEQLIKQYPNINWIRIGGHPNQEKGKFFISRIINKLFKLLYRWTRIKYFRINSINRTTFSLTNYAKSIKADIYIAHNLGALPAAVKAAKKFQTRSSIDFEDYYTGQWAIYSNEYNLYKFIEEEYLSKISFCTVASPLIAQKYKEVYPFLSPVVINNVFSKKYLQKETISFRKGDVLKLFWFSQKVGKDRGLEQLVKAMSKLDKYVSITILGECDEEYKKELLHLARTLTLISSQINFIDPVSPEKIFFIAAQHHVGLALESEKTINREICLTNKIFTYLLSGLAIIATNTLAQKQFLDVYSNIGSWFIKDDDTALSKLILNYQINPDQLQQHRNNALQLAADELNWENEEKKLLALINTNI